MIATFDRRWFHSIATRCGGVVVVVAHLLLSLWGAILLFRGANEGAEASWSQATTLGGALVASIPLAWLTADFLSGLVHFIADNCGSPSTPILGRAFIAPFREHHEHPEAMLGHGFLEKNASSALVSLPLLAWLPVWPPQNMLTWFLGAFSVQLALWLLLTNEIHAACHRPVQPRFLRWLQSRGIVLSPIQHRIHHEAARNADDSASPNRSQKTLHYCITSGACDRLFGRLARPHSPFGTASRVR